MENYVLSSLPEMCEFCFFFVKFKDLICLTAEDVVNDVTISTYKLF